MYPQFDPGTFHYAIGCSDEDTLTLMLSTKDEDTRLSVNGTQQSSNQNAEVELTGVSSDSDIAITLSNSDDATTTYVVHCLAADFPVITVTKRPEAWDGLILQSVGPQGENWSYLTIIDNNGVPWFRQRVDARAPHFRVFDDGAYPYAYTQSAGTIPNFRGGTSNNSILVVLDENLEQVQTVETVGLQHTDSHDFFVKRNGNYILLAYEPARRDLSDFTDEDGNAYSTTEGTEDSVIQEVTADGVEVFRWNSWDHMAIEDCTQHRFPWDYAHINSVEDVDGNILASFRGCSAVLMIDGQTGDVIWRLGRSNRSAEDWANTPPAPLTIKDDPYGEFCGQHSAKIIGNGNLLLFDNGTDCVVNPDTGISQRPSGVFSRVVEYSLDLEKGEATFVRHHSLHGTFMLWGRSGGLVSPMDNGNWLVSWGGGRVDKPPDQSVTEVNPGTGEQLLSIKFTYDGGRLATRSYALRQEQLTLGSAPPPPRPPGPGGGGGGGGAPRTSAPGAPRNLMAVGGDGQVVLTWDAPASDGGAEITDYEYRINGRNPWISTGSTETTYTVTGLVNGAAYTFQVRAVNRVGKSRVPNQAEVTPEAPEVLDFAHFANGDSITSDLVFVNVGTTQPIRPAIYFYDTEGAFLPAETVVDLTDDLEIAEDGGLTVRTEMEPQGELTIATHGRGELVSGSVKVISNGLLGGMLRFDLPGIGEAVVGASPPVSDVLFPVRRREEGITTGVAIHNLGAEAVEVSCRLMSGSAVLEEVEIPLEANGQTAWLIDAAFPAADTSDFAGSVHCDAPGRRRFSAVALEMDPGTRVFLTLPLFPVNRRAGGPEAALDFAHFANGDGTTSDLVFVNLSTERSRPAPTPFHTDIPPIRPAIYFYDTEGHPIAADSVVDVTGDLEIAEDGGLTVQTQMEPLGVLTISTHGQGALVSGSVRVVSEGPIGGMLRYYLPHIGVAVAGASQPVSDALFPVRRREEGITTGVALHNLESSPGLVHCDLMREGVLRDAASFPLEANGQTSWLIDQAFPGTDTADFTGSVRCDAAGEGRFSAVALEMDPATRTFTTLPVFPVPEMPPQE